MPKFGGQGTRRGRCELKAKRTGLLFHELKKRTLYLDRLDRMSHQLHKRTRSAECKSMELPTAMDSKRTDATLISQSSLGGMPCSGKLQMIPTDHSPSMVYQALPTNCKVPSGDERQNPGVVRPSGDGSLEVARKAQELRKASMAKLLAHWLQPTHEIIAGIVAEGNLSQLPFRKRSSLRQASFHHEGEDLGGCSSTDMAMQLLPPCTRQQGHRWNAGCLLQSVSVPAQCHAVWCDRDGCFACVMCSCAIVDTYQNPTDGNNTSSLKADILAFPREVLAIVVSHLHSSADVSRLSRTSKAFVKQSSSEGPSVLEEGLLLHIKRKDADATSNFPSEVRLTTVQQLLLRNMRPPRLTQPAC